MTAAGKRCLLGSGVALLLGAGVLLAPAHAQVPTIPRPFATAIDDACAGSNPFLATTCFNMPDARGQIAMASAVVAFRDTPSYSPQYTLAYWGQTGSVWGLAYDPTDDSVLAAAFHKRYASFGPGGPGAIYRVSLATTTVTTTFAVPDAGPDVHDARLPADDETARDLAGKTSLGDIDVDPGPTALFVVNLADRRIYRLGLPGGQVIGSYPHGAAGASWASDARPFGLKYHAARLFHGVVNSAESTQVRADLAAYVYSSLPDGSDMRLEVAVPLDYPRGVARASGLIGRPAIEEVSIDWQPWRDGYNHPARDRAGQAVYPQPILADIEFDAGGDMILGLRDRQGDMTMAEQIVTAGRIEKPGLGVGDIVRVPRVGGGWGTPEPEHYDDRTSLADDSALGGLAQLRVVDEVVAATFALWTAPGTPLTVPIALWYDNVRPPGATRSRWEPIVCGQFQLPAQPLLGLAAPRHNEWQPAADLGDVEELCGPPRTPTATRTGVPTPSPTPSTSPTPSPTATAPSSATVATTPSATATHRPGETPSATATASPTAPATATREPYRIYLPILARFRKCFAHADVALVLDMSTSMRRPSGSGAAKSDAALDAARVFVRLLDLEGESSSAHDQVAVVGFNDEAWVALPLSSDRSAIESALAGLPGRMLEGTRLDLAFDAGSAALASPLRRADNEPVLVLLTDGLPNRVPTPTGGGTQEDAVLARARAAKDGGITIYTVGLGAPEDVSAYVLSRAATRPSGYYYAPDGDVLASIYRQIAAQLPCPGVVPWPRPDPRAGAAVRARARDLAQDVPELSAPGLVWRGMVGGRATAIAAVGSQVVVGMGGRLVVLSVADPTTPRRLGETAPLGAEITAIAVGDGFAHVLEASSGLHVVDIHDPARPTVVGRLPVEGTARALAVRDGIAYVAAGAAGLVVIDVGVQTRPAEIGRLPTGRDTRAVVLAGDLAYVGERDTFEAGVRVVEVGDPRDPYEVAFVDTPNSGDFLALAGRYLFVLGVTGRVWTLDVAPDPAAPRRVGMVPLGGDAPQQPGIPLTRPPARGIVVVDEYAYVARDTGGLEVVDVQYPPRPNVVGTLDTPGEALGVAVRMPRGHAFVADGSDGVRVVDLRNRPEVRQVGAYETPGDVRDLDAAGGVLAVADQDYGLRLIDITDPTQPELRGGIDSEGTPTGVGLIPAGASAPDYAVLGETPSVRYVRVGDHLEVRYRGGLEVVDVGSLLLPRLVASLDGPSVAALAVGANTIHTAALDVQPPTPAPGTRSGYRSFSLLVPATPAPLGEASFPCDPRRIAPGGGYAYVACGATSGLVIVDVRAPETPQHESTLGMRGTITSVGLAGEHVVLGGDSIGITVVDVRDPAHPAVAGQVSLPAVRDLAVSGNLVAYVDATGEVGLVDIAAPQVPRVIDRFTLPGAGAGASSVAFDADEVYIGAPAAVFVLGVVERPVTPTPSPTASPTPGPASTATAAASPTVRATYPATTTPRAPGTTAYLPAVSN